jgi:hypothetical protein
MAENENAISPAPAEEGQAGGGAAAPAPEAAPATEAAPAAEAPAPAPQEEITYHAVEKDGQVTAIWEMQGRKHVRTIDPRSRQGQEILRLYTAEHHE